MDGLSRVEVERLLTLEELDLAEVACGSGVQRWVGPGAAREVWSEIEPWLDDVEPWRPPPGAAGMQPYRAELWRGPDGRHVVLLVNE